MDLNRIYQSIKEIANQLELEGATYSRADLAYELRDLGVEEDSLDLSRLVWEAYIYFNEDAKIAKAFLNNEENQSIVEEYKIHDLLDWNKEESIFSWIHTRLQVSDSSLKTLSSLANMRMRDSSAGKSSGLLDTITGAKGIKDVQTTANKIFSKYSKVVDSYSQASTDVKSVMKDFVELRGHIANIYQDYATRLIDIYGDSIKSVSPKLFDFDRVQFLDVESMLKDISLEYDRLSEKCAVICGEIRDSFANSLKRGTNSYNVAKNKGVGLLLAGISMANHYLDADEKELRSKKELEVFKLGVKHDLTIIKADYARLAAIFKMLNDLYIPKANAFYKYSGRVLTCELDQLFASLYQEPEIKALVEQRKKYLAELRLLESSIVDNELNIGYYTKDIKKCRHQLDTMKDSYQQAVQSKPQKPLLVVNLLTFGSAMKRYNKDVYEWSMNCAPVIEEYGECRVDIKLDEDELAILKSGLKNNKDAYRKLKRDLQKQQREMASKIRASGDMKLRMASHLESIIKLLHIAKEIVESKLDEKYINTVEVTDYRDIQLPDELMQGVQSFTNNLREHLIVDLEIAAKSIDYVDEMKKRGTKKLQNHQEESNSNEDEKLVCVADPNEIENVAIAGNELVQKSIDWLETWADLKMQQVNGALAAHAYDAELKKLQHDFQKEMSLIDDQSKVLAETLKRINTAANGEQLKEGLLLLASREVTLTADDLEQFLNGTKKIEI